MKKPDGKAEAGWYDAPELEGFLQYWNGKFWTKKKQIKDGFENLEVGPKYELGKFFFRNPIKNDAIFITYSVIAGIAIILSAKDILADISGIAGALLVIPAAALAMAYVYIIFLIVLIPRRILDKRKGIPKHTKLGLNNSGNEQATKTTKFRFNLNAKIAIAIVLAFFIPPIIALNIPNEISKSDGNKYFEIEQRISKVINEWNVAATPISEAIQLISKGEIDAAQARQITGDTSSKFAVIHNKLNDECALIPKYDLDSSGQEFAEAKAYDALKVTCDLLPQESIEILSLVNAQISPTGTQAKIEYHQNQIAIIIEKRRQAMIESLNALEPYITQAQKEVFDRLRKNFLE